MTLFRILALTSLIGLALPEARSQSVAGNYPERPIRLIVPFPAGGINDVLARAWADKITPHLGTIVIENRGGGGSMIGSGEAARAAPDAAHCRHARDTRLDRCERSRQGGIA